MITKSEKEALNNIIEADYYASIIFLALSRYHRIAKEAESFNKDLGPADFVAIVEESYDDYQNFTRDEE